jgi:hypothetical protein
MCEGFLKITFYINNFLIDFLATIFHILVQLAYHHYEELILNVVEFN